MKIPRPYLGTMTFGWSQSSSYVDEVVATEMVKRFTTFDENLMGNSHHYIDSARIYAGGKTEKIIGDIRQKLPSSLLSSLVIGTKAAPFVGEEGLSSKGIRLSLIHI